jgi:hypothetical protein
MIQMTTMTEKEKTASQVEAVIKRLKKWRQKNSLSQRQAVAIMIEHVLPMELPEKGSFTYQKWEGVFVKPNKFAIDALIKFIEAHPTIENPPVFGRWKNALPDEKVADMRKRRENGETLLSLAQRFGFSQSGVSRIVRGKRRKIG